MSFQAYLDNIRAKTGNGPDEFRDLLEKAGLYDFDMKAATLVTWLKDEFALGHGHSMAIWKAFKDRGWVADPKRAG